MHRADRPLTAPAAFTGSGVFIRHPRAHPRPDSRDERLAIEAGAYAELQLGDTPAEAGLTQTHPTPMPRPLPARDAIRS